MGDKTEHAEVVGSNLSIDDAGEEENEETDEFQSPLQKFTYAKVSLNQIINAVLDHLKDANDFLKHWQSVPECLERLDRCQDLKILDELLTQVSNISGELDKEKMKVMFFGNTSSGKSTVINAMLSEHILATGIGHTTNCFVSVEGFYGDEAYIEDPSDPSLDIGQRKGVESLQELTHAHHENNLDSSNLVQVFWPREKCPLFQDDIVLVDSPGFSLKPDVNNWIDKHCLDADAFVLIVNSETTITKEEKVFFQNIAEKFTKADMFVLFNRWDISAFGQKEAMKLVQQQHFDRAKELLVDELSSISIKDAPERIFFSSALEMLKHRISHKLNMIPQTESVEDFSELPEDTNNMDKDQRKHQFEDFEIQLKKCVSKKAIQTKFNGHTFTMLDILRRISKLIDSIMTETSMTKDHLIEEYHKRQESLIHMISRFKDCTKVLRTEIIGFSEEAEDIITKKLSLKVDQLENIIKDFKAPFDQPLPDYKRDLHGHIEVSMNEGFKESFTDPLKQSIAAYKDMMQDQIMQLIPDFTLSQIPHISLNSAYNYDLDMPNLCTGFQEQIDFQFFLGISSLIGKSISTKNLDVLLGASIEDNRLYVHYASPRKCLSFADTAHTTPSLRRIQTLSERDLIQDNTPNESVLTLDCIPDKMKLNSTITPKQGILVTAGIFWRQIGLKVVGLTCFPCGSVFIRDKTSWTTNKKEKVFKKQYLEHSHEEFSKSANFTTKRCSHQVRQELMETLGQLASQVDAAKMAIECDMKRIEGEIKNIQTIEKKGSVQKGVSVFLVQELASFMQEFDIIEMAN